MLFLHTLVRIRKYAASRCLLVMGIVCLFLFSVSAQDVEQVIKQKPLKVSGGVAANTTFYNAQGIANRRDPFYWMLNANLNFNIFGIIQAPFSMTLSQQKKNFSQPQPFNRFGISPKYKMVTTHFGYRSMSFSEYTLAGTMFLGAGVDVVPPDGFVRVSAMYGRLTKAVEKSAQEGLVFAKPAFKRIGYGVKVGLGRKKHMVDLILFKAKDDEHSITLTDADTDLAPEENLVGAIHSKHEFSDKVAVELEYAYSMFTRDVRSEKPESDDYTFANNLGGLFRPNLSSEFNKALTAVVNYNGGWYQANVKYRKIDPGYRTLGASFLNNGMKDLTGGLGWSMFQQKINISTNAGFQESTKENSVVRVIYAVNVNYNINTRMAVSTNYSNFSTSTRQTQIQRDIRYDTLEYFQVTRSGNANVSYKFGPDTNPQTLSLSGSVQDATDNGQSTSTFYSVNLGHQMKVAGLWQLGLAASYNKNYSVAMNTTTVGPVINLNRPFLKGKIRSACSAALLKSYLDNTLQSDVANISLTNSMKVGKKHSIAVNMYYLNSSEKKEEGKEYSEIRGMVNYSYSF